MTTVDGVGVEDGGSVFVAVGGTSVGVEVVVGTMAACVWMVAVG